jgi:hypothetical protein
MSKYRIRILIPQACLEKSRLTRQEQRIIISAWLACINLSIARSRVIYLNIPGFGKIFTHGNKKNLNKIKRRRMYNVKNWAKHKKNKINSEQHLLY